MMNSARSISPTIVLRIHGGSGSARLAFADFDRAVQSAEAYAEVGFIVDLISATGQFIMGFEPRHHEIAV